MSFRKELESIALDRKDESISSELIQRAFDQEEPEIKGLAYVLISDVFFSTKIKPLLTFEQYLEYVNGYFEYCLLNNPDGEWCHSRYAVCWDYANWFADWFEEDSSKLHIKKLISNIARLYKSSNDDIKLCLETAFIEHVLINKEILQFFVTEWHKDQDLSEVLSRCKKWSQQKK